MNGQAAMSDNAAPDLSNLLFNNQENSSANKEATTVAGLPAVQVEPCQIEFFYEKFKQCYPMFKNPRGQCLIINIYQINGMPPRRWSDRDTEALKQLFEQLLFTVHIYTDLTHDLSCQSFTRIVREFSESSEHERAQCCVVCLMSHGEEGFLTTKEGDKVLLDNIFAMFNNINCPSLAGKPKLFFIQSCRDDPITGPAEDLGIRLSFNSTSSNNNNNNNNDVETVQQEEARKLHENDGGCIDAQSDNSRSCAPSSAAVAVVAAAAADTVMPTGAEISLPAANAQSNATAPAADLSVSAFFHIPSLCDMLIGFPTQKGFIAYRKPEIGSWYMNAIVQVFSKHAHDTDLCAMLNMVNSLISNEVTNTGKKQMSEYTSKLTKPYFYFFPGLANDDEPEDEDIIETACKGDLSSTCRQPTSRETNGAQCCTAQYRATSNTLYVGAGAAAFRGIDDQTDSSALALAHGPKEDTNLTTNQPQAQCQQRHERNDERTLLLSADEKENTERCGDASEPLLDEHVEFICARASNFWKSLARAMDLRECELIEIDQRCASLHNKLRRCFDTWLDKCARSWPDAKQNKQRITSAATVHTLLAVLVECRLNKIKEDFIVHFARKERSNV